MSRIILCYKLKKEHCLDGVGKIMSNEHTYNLLRGNPDVSLGSGCTV